MIENSFLSRKSRILYQDEALFEPHSPAIGRKKAKVLMQKTIL